MSMSPFSQHQQLRRRVRDVPQDDAAHTRLLGLMRVDIDDHVVARGPLGQLEWPGAGGVALQPGVAEIAVGLVGHHRLHVHDAADIRRQAVEHEAGRLRLGQLDLQRVVVQGADHLLDVVGVEAELRDDEARRLVQLDHAMQAERGVVRGERIAGIEFRVALQLEGEGEAVRADRPLLREIAVDLAGVVHVGPDQPAVAVRIDLIVGELVGFRRIEAHDVVDRPGHDGDALGRGGVRPGVDRGRGDGGGRGGQQGASGQHGEVSRPDLLPFCQGRRGRR